MIIARTSWLLALTLFSSGLLSAQDGSDINQAIPIYFGQTVNDTVDNTTKPNVVYSIVLAKGQQLTATVKSAVSKQWQLCLIAPGATTLAKSSCLVHEGPNTTSALSIQYQVSTAGTYYIGVFATASSSTGIAYQLQVTAQGTPLITPNPATAGCVTGQVDSITYSLQLIAVGLPDEVSIGGMKLCSSCSVKPPAYPELANKMETAMSLNVGVSACYDSSGNIFQIKLLHP